MRQHIAERTIEGPRDASRAQKDEFGIPINRYERLRVERIKDRTGGKAHLAF
jgi:hypothetical protein